MELASTREHDDRDLSITKNSEFLSFLENSISSLGVGDLPVGLVLNPLDLDLSTTHLSFFLFLLLLLLQQKDDLRANSERGFVFCKREVLKCKRSKEEKKGFPIPYRENGFGR